MKVEFHVHTRFSKDSILNYLFLLIMLKLKKINCVAITDHNEIAGAIKYQKKLKKHNIDVIVGEEIFTLDGEIIGLYLKELIEPGLTCEETIKKIREQNGIVYVPHPYEPFRHKTVLKESCLKNFSSEIDLIECHNGRNRNKSISKVQLEIGEKYAIQNIIGSDAHTFFELGRNYIILDKYDRENILSSLKKGKFICSNCISFSHFWTKIARIIKIIEKGDFNELFRIIFKRSRNKDR